MPGPQEEHIRKLYAAFNERDVDAVLAGLTADVTWANGMEGGYVHGREAVRDYWTRQFAEIHSTVEPQQMQLDADGRLAVEVHQIVRSADGSELLADTTVRHLFTFTEGLVSRFDIE